MQGRCGEPLACFLKSDSIRVAYQLTLEIKDEAAFHAIRFKTYSNFRIRVQASAFGVSAGLQYGNQGSAAAQGFAMP